MDVDLHTLGVLGELLSGGGVLMFGVLVYLELRALRPTMSRLASALVILVERERMRDGRRAHSATLPDLVTDPEHD